MKRHNIERSVGDDEVIVRFDEVYEARKVTGRLHFEETYTSSSSGGVQFHSVVSDVQANGVLGLLYRTFGSRNMGKAFLSNQKSQAQQRGVAADGPESTHGKGRRAVSRAIVGTRSFDTTRSPGGSLSRKRRSSDSLPETSSRSCASPERCASILRTSLTS